MIQGAISQLVERRDLSIAEARGTMREIMEGQCTPAQIGSLLTALRMKGETDTEIATFAGVMREFAITIHPRIRSMTVDTCGTGGDATCSFNISTASAFVAAGAGVPIVKHGNRGVSSGCGSADVLAALGVEVNIPPARAAEIMEHLLITFLFAPNYHPAMRYAAGPRREIGLRTVFNLLGPLSNPAGAKAQLMGVYHPGLVEQLARVLHLLGVKRAMVVHGSGFDEITTTGKTSVSELRSGEIHQYELGPEDFGIRQSTPRELMGGDVKENARIMVRLLKGEEGAMRDVVLMNAGAAIYLGGKARSMERGIALAERSIDTGKASEKLNRLIEETGVPD
jgi:anthranilate phosphoribosyltransferase